MLFRQKFIDIAPRGRADAAHVSRNVTSYGMSEIARGRLPRLPVHRGCRRRRRRRRRSRLRWYWDQIRSLRSEAIVTVIPGSYVGYYMPHAE